MFQGDYPIGEYKSAGSVREMIEDESFIWYVLREDGRIIGSAVGTITKQNKSAEIGRTLISRDAQCTPGYITSLTDKLRQGLIEKDVELMWSAIRQFSLYKLAKRDGWCCAGHTNGEYIVGKREDYIIGIWLSESAKERRVMPPKSSIYSLKGVKRVMDEAGLEERVMDYPERKAVSYKKDYESCIKFSYHAHNRSMTMANIDDLPEHLQVTLLTDKEDCINYFLDDGYKISAFLPGWYLEDEKRYDCILMTKLKKKVEIPNVRFRKLIDSVNDEFSIYEIKAKYQDG